MNLNQAAHGDREHGFIGSRLRMPRKVIAGYWQDEEVLNRLGDWMKSAVGAAFSRKLKVMRFSDNMREVALHIREYVLTKGIFPQTQRLVIFK